MSDGFLLSGAGGVCRRRRGLDADVMMMTPGLIDWHVHITFGDYTPRQKTVGFLESYTDGGVTCFISSAVVCCVAAGYVGVEEP